MSRDMTFTGPTRTSPRWLGDPIGPQYGAGAALMAPGGKLDASKFLGADGAKVTLTAPASVDAVSIAVQALTNKVPAGTPLDFGGKKLAVTTAEAAAGATAIAVRALATALVGNETATYAGTKKKLVESGTPVSRLYSERDAGTGFHPAVATDDEFYLVVYDNDDVDKLADVELLRPAALVKENYLPGWSTMASDIKAKIRATYRCITGVN